MTDPVSLRARCGCALFLCALFLTSPAHALDFNFTYNADASTPPSDISNSFGPINDDDGQDLLNMMEVAGDMWADIILDDFTVNVEVRYQAPANPGNSAFASTFADHPDNTDDQPATDGARVQWGMIILNPNRKWWVDSSPLGHSEFDMAQTLYRDLPSDQQTGWFNGSPPALLEAGFSGAVNSSAPDAMQFPGSEDATVRSRDMLTYALHEIGHMLGVSSVSAAADEFETDGDYDISPNLAGGSVFAIESASTSDGHITSTPTSPTAPVLMHTNNLCCARRLPSALDVMAAESTANWTDIRLPRIDFLTGFDWNTAGSWEGDRTPSTAVDAFVRHGDTVTMSGFGAAGDLAVDEGSIVSTQDNTLFIQNSTTVGGAPGPVSQITINTDGQLDSDILTINLDGRVRLVGDSSLLQSERVTINSGGVLDGRGTVDINDDLLGQLTLDDGAIRVTGGELLIQSQNGLALELQSGDVEVIDGDLRFDTGFLDSIGADITVGAGRQVAFELGATIGAGGRLQLEGVDASPAVSTGSTLFVGLNGVVNASGVGEVNNALVLQPSGVVTTQFGDPDSEIRLNGPTFLLGGGIVGHGAARQNGDVEVSADTQVTIDTYDMDGQSGDTAFTIAEGATLQVDSPNIDTTGGNECDGTINVNGGSLAMAPDWSLRGVLNLTETGATPVVTGPGSLTVLPTGQINVSGAGVIESDTTLSGGLLVGSQAEFNGEVLVTDAAHLETDSPGDVIEFNDATTLDGGSYVGGGLLRFNGPVRVIGDTSVGMADTDLDGTAIGGEIDIDPGVRFSVSSITLDPDDGAYDDVMNVRGEFSSIVSFALDGALNMIQEQGEAAPQLAGAGDFIIRTAGEANTSGDAEINRSMIVQGALNVGAGTTHVQGAAILFENTAQVSVADGGTLVLGGVTTYEGGVHMGEGLVQFNGQTNIDAHTSINVARVDLDGQAEDTVLNLNDARLELNVDFIETNSILYNGEAYVTGPDAQLAVVLSNPVLGWRQMSDSVINFENTAPAAGAVAMLTGSPLSAEGVVNATGPLSLAADVAIRNRLNAVTRSTNVHFGGPNRSTVHANITATIAGAGDITVDHGATVNLEGETRVAVDTTNDGRLEIGFLASEVSVDYRVPAHAVIRGDYAQLPAGELAVDLAGTTPTTEHDWLEVIGLARLNGVIEATLIDGFVPQVGQMFQVLTATQVVNEFDVIETIDENDVLGFDLTALYTDTDVTLLVDDVFLIGDYNDDGVVDAADYAVWRDNLGAPAGALPNDIHDTPIGPAQYETWRSHYGNTHPDAGAPDADLAPEPGAWLMAATALGAVLARQRGRRARA